MTYEYAVYLSPICTTHNPRHNLGPQTVGVEVCSDHFIEAVKLAGDRRGQVKDLGNNKSSGTRGRVVSINDGTPNTPS